MFYGKNGPFPHLVLSWNVCVIYAWLSCV